MKDNKPMNERIKEIRKKHGISTTTLAGAVGLAQPTISRYENGEIPLNTDKAFEILDALNCDIEIIENPMPKPSKERLETIAKTQLAEDIIELQFLTNYGRQRTSEGKRRCIERFSAGYYELDSGRPTSMDKGSLEIDEELTKGFRKED